MFLWVHMALVSKYVDRVQNLIKIFRRETPMRGTGDGSKSAETNGEDSVLKKERQNPGQADRLCQTDFEPIHRFYHPARWVSGFPFSSPIRFFCPNLSFLKRLPQLSSTPQALSLGPPHSFSPFKYALPQHCGLFVYHSPQLPTLSHSSTYHPHPG